MNNLHRIAGDWGVDEVLRGIEKADMESIVVIGWSKRPDEDGNLFQVFSTFERKGDVIYALQQANLTVLEYNRS